MSEVTTIGLDIAKNVFHAHGADASGKPLFSRKISRTKLLEFFAKQPRCLVALEACGGAHHWARELTQQGHQVKLIPPAYVRPFVKRNKNDAVDAEAICEAAQRPNMRFVAIKSEEQQASALVFRTRDLLVRQRTQLINAIRGHLTEYGWVAPKGPSHIAVLGDLLDGEMGSSLPDAATPMFHTMLDLLEVLSGKIAELDKEIARRAREDVIARRLMTIPGVGPITATAIAALAPPAETFAKGRDFAAWLGLAPPQLSSGGKQKLGSITKMGERTLTGLNQYDDERLIRAHEAMILAVQIFNSPALKFKTEVFTVLTNLAWTYLLHEFYDRKGTSIVQEDGRSLLLSQMVKKGDCPLSEDVRNNLRAMKILRDKVEHLILGRADLKWSPIFQACCLNFDKAICDLFGASLTLASERE